MSLWTYPAICRLVPPAGRPCVFCSRQLTLGVRQFSLQLIAALPLACCLWYLLRYIVGGGCGSPGACLLPPRSPILSSQPRGRQSRPIDPHGIPTKSPHSPAHLNTTPSFAALRSIQSLGRNCFNARLLPGFLNNHHISIIVSYLFSLCPNPLLSPHSIPPPPHSGEFCFISY